MVDPEYLKLYQHNLGTMLWAAGTEDPDTFAEIVRLLDDARAQLPAAAQRLKQPQDSGQPAYSWQDLGNALGVTASAACQRFGPTR